MSSSSGYSTPNSVPSLAVPIIVLDGMKIRMDLDVPYTNRLFNPNRPPGVVWSQVYNPVTTLTSLRPNIPPNVKLDVPIDLLIYLLISVDGRCKDVGTPHATAAYGMYFGPNSPYNRCSLLPESEKQTNSSAELFAVLSAICFVKEQNTRPLTAIPPLKKVVIQTDSSYVVECLTKNIWTWQENGYQNSRGIQTSNIDLIYDIHHLLADVKRDLGMNIRFQHVPRVENKGADRLAKLAFDWESQFTYRNEEPAFPTTEWKHASKYAKDLSPREIVSVHRTLSRLEWPLPLKRENMWIDSIISYMIRGNLLLQQDADFPSLFEERFGRGWRKQVARERDKIAYELMDAERGLKRLPSGAGMRGSREWIGYHLRLAQLGTLLATISEERLDDSKHSHIA